MEAQLTVRLPEKLASRLDRYAKRLGLKRSDLVRLALQQFVGGGSDAKSLPRIYEQVRPLLGVFETGVADLGSKHREHLLKRIRRNA